MDNISMFELIYPTYKTDKPIRLIELFAGVGSQAMALRNIGIDFEHYKVVEFDRYAIASYNAIHGTNFETTDISEIKGNDLEITDTDKYCYIMTYSFPCQDLSLAGNRQGMSKGSGTRSGLLWEVERLLNEVDNLPQVLLMENVPQVISQANIADFHEWQKFLEEKGYSNYVDTLNAKDYGVAQNRNRTFMVSILGGYHYKFPVSIPLTKAIVDYLEPEVDEKYYINSDKAQKLINQLIESGQLEGGYKDISYNPIQNLVDGTINEPQIREVANCITSRISASGITNRKQESNAILVCIDGTINEPKAKDIANCIKARYDCGISNQKSDGTMVVEPTVKIKQATKEGYIECKLGGVADLSYPNSQTRRGRVQDNGDISPTITATETGVHKIESPYRIRKLTTLECWRLMGFTDEDFYKAEKVNSNTQLYKQAGNSIVVDVLEGIFRKIFYGEVEHRTKQLSIIQEVTKWKK